MRSQFISLTALPPERPSICVCTAPLTPVVQRSCEYEEPMLGAIALGGGDLIVVSLLFLFTLLLVLSVFTVESLVLVEVDVLVLVLLFVLVLTLVLLFVLVL